ncbi:MAG TPA: hypothetical protein VII58_02170 [Acidobacteriaceae bacterium]
MPAHVIHVGQDYWHRLQVLQSAGLHVEQCRDLQALQLTLRTGTDPHAILLAASPDLNPAQVMELVRPVTKCPVILFSTGKIVPDPKRYDLVVHPLTDPSLWLAEVRETIRKSEALRAHSEQVRGDSIVVRETSEKSRRDSSELRRAAREERERTERLIKPRRQDGE